MPPGPSPSFRAPVRAAVAATTAVVVSAGLLTGLIGSASAAPSPVAADPTPPATSSPTASPSATPSPTGTTTGTPAPSPTGTGTPSPTPTPLPKPRTMVTAELTWPTGVPGSPSDGTRVGVGILPVLRFSTDIPRRAVVEENIAVTANRAKVKGSWAWVGTRTAVFRPKKFWPGRSKIRIEMNLADQVLGMQGKRYLVGAKSMTTTYTFGTARSWIARINASSHQMTIKLDGKVVKKFGVSLGMPGWESRSGYKVYYGDKEASHTYTSDALGVDEYYRLTAPWNIRLTPTGEFIHTARWAYYRIGRANGSHGCTNMFEQDAKWIYDRVIPGDVFSYTGTSKSMESTNGPLAMWNIPWTEWKAKSALA